MTREEELILVRRLTDLEEEVKSLKRTNNDVIEVDHKDIKIKELENVNAKLRDDFNALNHEFSTFKRNIVVEHMHKLEKNYITEDMLVAKMDMLAADIKSKLLEEFTNSNKKIQETLRNAIDIIIKYKDQFATQKDLESYIDKHKYNNDMILIKNDLMDIITTISEYNRILKYKMDRDDAQDEVNKLKAWWINEYSSLEYLKKSELDVILDEYQTRISTDVMFDDLTLKIKDLNTRIEITPTKEEVNDILKSSNIETDKSKLYYSSDIIDAKLSHLIKYDEAIRIVNNVYDKTAINNKIQVLASKSEITDLSNKVNDTIDKLSNVYLTKENVIKMMSEYTSRLSVVEQKQDLTSENMKDQVKLIRTDVMDLVKDILNTKVNSVNDRALGELAILRDLLTKLESSKQEYVTKEMLYNIIREG